MQDDPQERFDDILNEYLETTREGWQQGATSMLGLLTTLCEEAPDADHIGVLAVLVLDELLDDHWAEVGEPFEALMRENAAIRQCWSHAMPDLPQGIIDRLDALLLPGERSGPTHDQR